MADQNKELYDRCHAAKYSSKAAKEAIDAGLDVNWVSSRFGTSLWLVMCASNNAMGLDMLEKFKLAGADMNAAESDGCTPLHAASNEDTPQHAEVVKWLVGNGASLEAVDEDGLTPLHLAAMQGSAHCAEMLIALGANLSAKANGKDTPATLARKEGHGHLIALLTAAATATATSFTVFEAQSRRTTTSDSRGLLCGVEPSGSGDWDCTITAKPKNADSGDSPTREDANKSKTLEDVMYLLSCDHKYICPTGGCPVMSSAEATEPCACWQGKKNIPQNVDEVCEWDGNSGEVCWETDTHVFEMEYATS